MPQTVDDPRAYVIEAWTSDERKAWLSAPWLSPRSAEVIDPILADLIRRERFDTLPNDQRELDRFARKTRSKYASRALDSEAGRAEIEQRLSQRFEQPEITFENGIATADLGFVPGKVVPAIRAGWKIESDPERIDRREPTQSVVQHGFAKAYEAHPDARGWKVKVQLFKGAHRRHFRYGYDVGRDRLFTTADSKHFIGFEDVGGIEALIEGRVPTHTAEMDSLDAEWQLHAR